MPADSIDAMKGGRISIRLQSDLSKDALYARLTMHAEPESARCRHALNHVRSRRPRDRESVALLTPMVRPPYWLKLSRLMASSASTS